jgi:predicted amidophosphoribosyltransferase
VRLRFSFPRPGHRSIPEALAACRRAAAALAPHARGIGTAVLDILAPGFCRRCGVDLPAGIDGFCSDCLSTVVWIGSACPRCAMPLASPPPPGSPIVECGWCLGRKLRFDLAAAGGAYDGALRSAILGYKFHGDRGCLPLIREALLRAAASDAVAPLVARTGAIVPVPQHFLKRLRRGWDPVGDLALDLSRRIRIPVARLLAKVRRTPSQVSLPEAARRRNLRGAFALRGRTRVPPVVILLDDVLTTGTTVSRAALALKRAGAETVLVLVAARS